VDYTKRRLNYSLLMKNQACIIFLPTCLHAVQWPPISLFHIWLTAQLTHGCTMYTKHDIIISQRSTCKFSTKNTAMALSFSLGDCIRNLWQFCSLMSAVDCGWSVFTHTCSNFCRPSDSVHFARIPRTG
jgi:hypothetical protein